MHFVLRVMAASILAGSMHFVSGSQSTSTAVAPAIQMASAVAKNVFALVMTSSWGSQGMVGGGIIAAGITTILVGLLVRLVKRRREPRVVDEAGRSEDDTEV